MKRTIPSPIESAPANDEDYNAPCSTAMIESMKRTLNDEVVFRYISASDQHQNSRDNLIRSAIEKLDYYNLVYTSTFSLSRSIHDYDVLILGGADALRLSKYLRENQKLIIPRIKIAVMNGTDPRRRALIINAGFDDVLDSARVSAEEVICRIHALWSRNKINLKEKLSQEELYIPLTNYLIPNVKLAPSEYRVLNELIRCKRKTATYQNLAHKAGNKYEYASQNAVKVIVSNIRKKLNEKYKIICNEKEGYLLVEI